MKNLPLRLTQAQTTADGKSSPVRDWFLWLSIIVVALLVGEVGGFVIPAWAEEIRLLVWFVCLLSCSGWLGAVGGAIATVISCAAASLLWRASGGRLGLQPRLVAVLFGEGALLSLVGWSLLRARVRQRAAQIEMNDMERKILEIGDEERQRLGHDLHDGLGQHLTGISLLSETLAQQASAGIVPKPTEVERITQLSSDAVRQARELARSLSPLTLEQEGFVAAMEELAQNAANLLSIQCEWEEPDAAVRLNPARALHLYRIVQEAINNSVRHGKARRVLVTCQVSGDDLVIEVVDDGNGLSKKTAAKPGLGLRIMRHRAKIAEIELTADRAEPAGGTRVRCRCKMDGADATLGS